MAARSWVTLLLLSLASLPAAQAGPVVCTTSLEAPPEGTVPVEVSRCGPVTTTQELMVRRFYSYSSPYARGIDVTHQITDILGIAMGGGDGTKVMGLGFPDQTIVWDGSAVENTYQVLLEQQSHPLPWRTADVSNGFCAGLSRGGCGTSAPAAPIRGLW
ncbi:Occludin/ELL family protein [Vulcanococcus sp.]|jgi:hypothetical protein|uniref:Occludin/ELL family protein n=1 Tax=Vulcanococcus sp. TaxID=2856995 RepID=UPI003BFE0811